MDQVKNNPTTLYIITGALLVGGAFLYAAGTWGLIAIKPDVFTNAPDILMKFTVIIVAIERAAAVWVGMKRNEMAEKWKSRVNRMDQLFSTSEIDKEGQVAVLKQAELEGIYKQEEKVISGLDPAPAVDLVEVGEKGADAEEGSPESIAYKSQVRGYLRQVRIIYTHRSELHNITTNIRIAQIVFFVGIIFSIVGLSLLEDVLDINSLDAESPLYFAQKLCYRAIDVFVTGGLIGGGSVGLTKLFDKLNSFSPKG